MGILKREMSTNWLLMPILLILVNLIIYLNKVMPIMGMIEVLFARLLLMQTAIIQ